jgi:hypothetical protein
MKRIALAGVILAGAFGLGAGCATVAQRGEEQIRARLGAIRGAILAKDGAGVVRWATADWVFVDHTGRTFNQAAYLERVRGLFATVVAIDRLDTQIDRIAMGATSATVELTQTMERREQGPGGGRVGRVRLRYREAQAWILVDGEWRVRRVEFVGPPERTELGEP